MIDSVIAGYGNFAVGFYSLGKNIQLAQFIMFIFQSLYFLGYSIPHFITPALPPAVDVFAYLV